MYLTLLQILSSLFLSEVVISIICKCFPFLEIYIAKIKVSSIIKYSIPLVWKVCTYIGMIMSIFLPVLAFINNIVSYLTQRISYILENLGEIIDNIRQFIFDALLNLQMKLMNLCRFIVYDILYDCVVMTVINIVNAIIILVYSAYKAFDTTIHNTLDKYSFATIKGIGEMLAAAAFLSMILLTMLISFWVDGCAYFGEHVMHVTAVALVVHILVETPVLTYMGNYLEKREKMNKNE